MNPPPPCDTTITGPRSRNRYINPCLFPWVKIISSTLLSHQSPFKRRSIRSVLRKRPQTHHEDFIRGHPRSHSRCQRRSTGLWRQLPMQNQRSLQHSRRNAMLRHRIRYLRLQWLGISGLWPRNTVLSTPCSRTAFLRMACRSAWARLTLSLCVRDEGLGSIMVDVFGSQ